MSQEQQDFLKRLNKNQMWELTGKLLHQGKSITGLWEEWWRQHDTFEAAQEVFGDLSNA